jgi:prophage regulatory protein
MNTVNGNNILRMNQLSLKVGLSKSLLYALIAKSEFPKPFVLIPGGRAVGWLEADVNAWLLQRKTASSKVAL